MLMKLLFVFSLIFAFNSYSQSPVEQKLTLNDLEEQFLEKNYQLLATKYDIDIADAAIIQAKLWKNPTLTLGQVNLWKNNTATEQAPLFHNFGRYQQFTFDLGQVIETAGKRKKRVVLANTQKNTALIEFESLVLDLKLKLRNSYYELYQIQQIKSQLTTLTDYYSDLATAFERQVANQNLSKADFYRIKTALLDVQQQAIEWNNRELEAIQTIKILTQLPNLSISQLVFPTSINTVLSQEIPSTIMSLVKDSSIAKQYALQQVTYSEQYLKLEKANAKPDVSVLMNYDRSAGYMRDFVGFGVGIDLPIFNRNQGNIKLATAQLDQQKLKVNSVDLELETTITKLVEQLKAYEKLLQQYPSTSLEEFKTMMDNYVKHLKSQQVSLFEFIDFSDAYLQSQSRYYEIEKNYLETFEQIQNLIGKDL